MFHADSHRAARQVQRPVRQVQRPVRQFAGLERLPWFTAFRRAQGNFAFGLNALTEPEWIAAFTELAADAGVPSPAPTILATER